MLPAIGRTNRIALPLPSARPADMDAMRKALLNTGGISLVWHRGLEVAAIGKDVNIRVPLEGHPDQRVMLTFMGKRRELSTDEINEMAGCFTWGSSAQSQLPQPQIDLMNRVAGRLFLMAGNT